MLRRVQQLSVTGGRFCHGRHISVKLVGKENSMKKFAINHWLFPVLGIGVLGGLFVGMGPALGQADEKTIPIFVTDIPSGYRDWKVVSVAHEAGDLNDIRAVLGNDIAIKAYRDGKLPFPEGAIVGRIAWSYVPSDENNKTFGREQSFVAGSPTDFYLQFMVKDSKKYAATGGWGYSSFDKSGKPTDAASMQSCFPCHQAVQSRDYVFTRYTP
jgi:cytochrome P460